MLLSTVRNMLSLFLITRRLVFSSFFISKLLVGATKLTPFVSSNTFLFLIICGRSLSDSELDEADDDELCLLDFFAFLGLLFLGETLIDSARSRLRDGLFDLDCLRDEDLDCLVLVSLLSLLLFGVRDLFRLTLALPRDLLLDMLLDLLFDLLIDLLRDLLRDRVFVLGRRTRS